jgi:anti-sigma B factor antagonist
MFDSLKTEEVQGIPIVSMRGQFVGGKETDELRSTLKTILEQGKKHAVVSLKDASYLNSTALGVLISAHASFAKEEGKIALCNISDSIENIFVITKLTLVFDISPSTEEAVSKLTSMS